MAKELQFRNEFHAIMYKYTESKFFSCFIFSTNLINTILLTAQTWRIVYVRAAWYMSATNSVFLAVYLMELLLKLYVWRLRYFHDGWNVFDFVLVLLTIADFLSPFLMSNVGPFPLRFLLIFRFAKAVTTLRSLLATRFLTNLHVIQTTIIQSLRSIGVTVLLIVLTMYVFAVIGRGLYGGLDKEHFGSLFQTLFTLFQLLTLDDWFEVYEAVAEHDCWHIFLYLVLYIIIEYFIFLNLVVAVLVDTFQLALAQSDITPKRNRKTAKKYSEEDNDSLQSDYSDSSITGSFISVGSGEELPKKRTLDEYYPHLPDEERDKLRRYFRILASIDYNYMMLGRQQAVINMMADICEDNESNLYLSKDHA